MPHAEKRAGKLTATGMVKWTCATRAASASGAASARVRFLIAAEDPYGTKNPQRFHTAR